MLKLKPVKLKKGDIIDVIAPSFDVSFEHSLIFTKLAEIFDQIGLKLRIPNDLIDTSKDLFCANSLEYRANHLIESLNASDSAALWAIRGGYGAAQLIPFLEKIEQPKLPKYIIGFSDITALQLYVIKNWNWQALHAPVLNQIIKNPSLLDNITKIIMLEDNLTYSGFELLNDVKPINNELFAEITGGNCSLVQTSIGSSWEAQTENKILFLEDVGECGYKIHRMLNHFVQAGLIDKAKAIIFGIFNDSKDRAGKDQALLALRDFASKIKIPVLHFPFIGHDQNNNLPLPLGALSKLSFFKDSVTLSII